jgi:hypothetical protein
MQQLSSSCNASVIYSEREGGGGGVAIGPQTRYDIDYSEVPRSFLQTY